MQRNTSFFWNTDSFTEDDDDNAPTVGLILEGEDEDDTEPSDNNHRRLFSPHNTAAATVTATATTKRDATAAPPRSIRFQVVLWYVGAVDVVLGHVPMRFRVSLFWNDIHSDPDSFHNSIGSNKSNHQTTEVYDWTMQGRMFACRQERVHNPTEEPIHVPPLSILNAVNHTVIGTPEVTMLRHDTRLMRWTCMYSATLFQGDNLRVENFPHDRHDLVLKLGILAHRRPGGVWDRRKWRLSLATEQDSQGSTRIPYSLVVDHVTVPNFCVEKHELGFEFKPLPLGSGEHRTDDQCLQVMLTVHRESRHYDKNIVPLLGVLNVVAISCLPRNFASATASTETMLSIAFVEIGIRLTIDSHLPGVGYQIKIQRLMNRCFWLLCFLVLESNVNFFLVKKMGWKISTVDWVDLFSAIGGLIYTVEILMGYYSRPQIDTGNGYKTFNKVEA